MSQSRLSLADQIALIYTSAGSQRKVAALIGISHQKVGRILQNQYGDTSAVLKSPELRAQVAQAFEMHKDITRQQAKADDLPYSAAVPVFIRRYPFAENGVPGDRVGAEHIHWINGDLKARWLRAMHESGKFYSASVGSIVNLVVYSKRSDPVNRAIDSRSTPEDVQQRMNYKEQIQRTILRDANQDPAGGENQSKRVRINDQKIGTIRQETITGRINTKYTAFERRYLFESALSDMVNQLRAKHEPAATDPGTVLGDRILFQVDTRKNKDGRFRQSHPIPKRKKPATKRNKAR